MQVVNPGKAKVTFCLLILQGKFALTKIDVMHFLSLSVQKTIRCIFVILGTTYLPIVITDTRHGRFCLFLKRYEQSDYLLFRVFEFVHRVVCGFLYGEKLSKLRKGSVKRLRRVIRLRVILANSMSYRHQQYLDPKTTWENYCPLYK